NGSQLMYGLALIRPANRNRTNRTSNEKTAVRVPRRDQVEGSRGSSAAYTGVLRRAERERDPAWADDMRRTASRICSPGARRPFVFMPGPSRGSAASYTLTGRPPSYSNRAPAVLQPP